MSLQFVRELELEVNIQIGTLTERVMNGNLTDQQYIKMTASVATYKHVLSLARFVLKRMGEDDEGDEGDNVISARGRQPNRL